MEQKLHTPEGVRDIYHMECKKKLAVQGRLHNILHAYGYQDIQTPTFEYMDVFREEIGTISSRELYKFFDREGNTLALRPDITPSIARAAATLFETEDFPVRLCYMGSTFINHISYQGRLKENTQMGAELIGLHSIEADAELIAMVVDGLKSAGLKQFQVNIGHVDFLKGLLLAAGLKEEERAKISHLIANRNYFGVEEILDESCADESTKHAFQVLPELAGDCSVLKKAQKTVREPKSRAAIAHLLKLYKVLTLYGIEKHVTFDLSMSGSYGYYTGVIFRAYTYGTGDAVVRGGRYDRLQEKFGKKTPSIGFAVLLDELMSALERQKIPVETSPLHLIVYTDTTQRWAIDLAKNFRAKGKCVELDKRGEEASKDAYKAYGSRIRAASMLYLREDLSMIMVNLSTGLEKVIHAGEEKGGSKI